MEITLPNPSFMYIYLALYVRADIDSDAVATFIVASNQGLAGLMKNFASLDILRPVISVLVDYLETLRPRVQFTE